MNILAITGSYPPDHGGGYGLHMSWFCEGLGARGHSVRVLTTAAGSKTRDFGHGAHDVARVLEYIVTPGAPWRLLSRTRRNVAAVRDAVREVRPDVIFCGGFDGVGFNTYLAVLESGVPSLTWLGDTWLNQAWRNLRRYDLWTGFATPRGGLGGWVKRPVAWYGRWCGLFDGPEPRTFGRVAAISRFVLDDLRQSGAPVPADTPVIPVCLHPAFQKSDTEPVGHGGKRSPHLRALFVGRMERLKGPDMALRALAAAVARGADVRLTFAGLGLEAARPGLQAEATALGVADRVDWKGTPSQTELADLYRDHDVFLFPSRIVEGLGVVNCEAIACGLPVIGTADSGASEVIVPGETGFRVAIDDADAMGQHLVALHSDRALLEGLSATAVRFSRRFLRTAVLDRLEAELLRAAGPGTA